MTELNQLDKVLRFIADNNSELERHETFEETGITSSVKYQPEIPGVEAYLIEPILNKLLKNENIGRYESIASAPMEMIHFYQVTFEGLIFINQGGYQGKVDRENEDKNRLITLENTTKANQRWIFLLTILVAFGSLFSGIWYAIGLWKYFVHQVLH